MNVKIFLKLMIIFIAFMKYLTFCCFTRSLVKLITFSKSLFKERNWAFWPSKVSNWLTCCNCWWYRFNLASISSRLSIIVKCKIPERVTQRYFKWIRNIFNLYLSYILLFSSLFYSFINYFIINDSIIRTKT